MNLNRSLQKLFLLSFFCSFSLFEANAQNTEFVRKPYTLTIRTNPEHTFPNRFWVDASAAAALIGSKNTQFGNNYGGNLHYVTNNRYHYQIRYNNVNNRVPLTIGTGTGFQEIHEFGYMIGALLARKYFLAEIAVGPSIVAGVRLGNADYTYASGYKSEKFVAPGFSVEADFKFMARRYAGIGLVSKVNVNGELSFVSFGFELTLNGPN